MGAHYAQQNTVFKDAPWQGGSVGWSTTWCKKKVVGFNSQSGQKRAAGSISGWSM